MNPLLDQIAAWLETGGCGETRFGRERALDVAAAVGSVWNRDRRVLLCQGPEESGARAVAATAARTWSRPRPPYYMDATGSSFALLASRACYTEDRLRELEATYHVDGLGLEKPDDDVRAFLDRWLARAGERHARQVMFVWTPLGCAALTERYGPHVVDRLVAASSVVDLRR
ncbi:MAG: hypothetical protein IJV65_06640 [Kiritimatiellae bacterium]|nr:hypothetical protein [Kiritimatiellia bacterium]